ncbi:hypothetical protein POM88_027476 [Heracleum sosnowskyi]|uniref:Uncharacterized protein n=1 Tax=Heracleum sosnowskyi TaxID=360622 RepID=A0AAD8MPZ6_9APIA|nr:hypothetical protein POM88_027476 [Heracleum sosnowskyi]
MANDLNSFKSFQFLPCVSQCNLMSFLVDTTNYKLQEIVCDIVLGMSSSSWFSWILANIDNAMELHGCLEGFRMNMTRSDDVFVGNEVVVMFPHMHCNDLLVVHGINPFLLLHKNSDEDGIEPSNLTFIRIL